MILAAVIGAAGEVILTGTCKLIGADAIATVVDDDGADVVVAVGVITCVCCCW